MRRATTTAVVGALLSLAACSHGGTPQSKPSSADTYVSAGIAVEQQGDLPGARALFLRALQVDPVDAYAHYNLGTVYQRQGQLPAALGEYAAAVAARPAFTDALYNEGTVLLQTDPAAAVVVLGEVVKQAPSRAAAWVNLGDAERKLGHAGPARRDLAQGLRLDPSLRTALDPRDAALLAAATSPAGHTGAPSPSPSASS